MPQYGKKLYRQEMDNKIVSDAASQVKRLRYSVSDTAPYLRRLIWDALFATSYLRRPICGDCSLRGKAFDPVTHAGRRLTINE
jgi:hypothetical protein